MYICININSRVTELYHTLRSIEDEQRLLRVKIQNEKDTQGRNQIKSVKDCQSSLSNLGKQKNKNNKPHTLLWHSHTLCRESFSALVYKAICHAAVRPVWSVWIDSAVNVRFREVEGRRLWRLDRLTEKIMDEEKWESNARLLYQVPLSKAPHPWWTQGRSQAAPALFTCRLSCLQTA